MRALPIWGRFIKVVPLATDSKLLLTISQRIAAFLLFIQTTVGHFYLNL